MAAPAVGLIGPGTMGGAFARHLLAAGYAVSGYDIDAKRGLSLKRDGGRPAASVSSVSRERPVIITSLPTVAACETVFFGAGTSRMFEVRGAKMVADDLLERLDGSGALPEGHRHHRRLRGRAELPDAALRHEQAALRGGPRAGP